MNGFYDWLRAQEKTRPLMKAEHGVDVTGQPELQAVLEEAFPAVKPIVYWNDEQQRLDHIDGQPLSQGPFS